MNIRDLEYVIAVADKRHFGLAAEACNVSQPALSAQIKKLEDELGIRLFDRTTRDVVVTEAASFVINNARIILEKAGEIKKHAHYMREGHKTRIINLGIIPTIAPYYLPEFFAKVGHEYKDMDIRWQVHEEKTKSLLQRLAEGRIDGAILSLPLEGPDYPAKKLFDEPFFLAVPTGHALAAHKTVIPQDLADAEWLLLDDGHCLNDAALDICTRAKNAVNQHSFRATSLETLRHMVASDSGVTLMPGMARRNNDGIVYIPFKDATKYKRTVGLVWRKDSLFAKELEAMANTLLVSAKKGR